MCYENVAPVEPKKAVQVKPARKTVKSADAHRTNPRRVARSGKAKMIV